MNWRSIPVALVASLGFTPVAIAAQSQTSLRAVEAEVMCVECGTPLNISTAPIADRERAFISREIAAGKSKEEIKAQLIREFGPAVLAMPRARGFNWAIYIGPPLLVTFALGMLGFLVSRSRKRARHTQSASQVTAGDLRRVEVDFARYER